MLWRGMHDKPIEISQGSLGSLRAAVSSPSPKVVGGRGGYGLTWGTAKHGTLPEFRLYQRRLAVGDQVTGHM